MRLPSISMAFDGPAEQHFRTVRNTRARTTNIVSLLVCGVIYNLFLVTDTNIIPDVMTLAVVLRLGIVTPTILLFLAIQHAIVRHRPDSRIPGRLAIGITILIFASILILQAATGLHTAAEYFTGTFLVLVAFNCIRYGSFADQMIGSLIMCALFIATMRFVDVVDPATKADATLTFCCCAVITLLGAYRGEFLERSSFEAQLREQELRATLDERNAQLFRLSHTDPLTGVANRRAFDQRLCDAETEPVDHGILMVDVDFFKAYNDHYGHAGGDQCLRQVAQAMADEVRPGDLVARYGGEEFAVVLSDVSAEEILRIGERIRACVESLAIPHAMRPDSARSVTVSVGGTLRRRGQALPLLACVAQADEALYDTKRSGRNRVSLGISRAA